MVRYSLRPDGSLPFAAQLTLCRALVIPHLELGECLDGVPLAELGPEQVNGAREALIDAGVRLVCADAPLEAAPGERSRAFLRAAHTLGAESLRLCPPPGLPPEAVITAAAEFARLADSYGIRCLAENSPEGFLSTDADMQRLQTALKPWDGGCVFHPARHAALSRHPFLHVFYASHLKNRIRVLRVADGRFDGTPVPVGQGDGEIKELLSILLARSFDGYLSLPWQGQRDAADWEAELVRLRRLIKAL